MTREQILALLPLAGTALVGAAVLLTWARLFVVLGLAGYHGWMVRYSGLLARGARSVSSTRRATCAARGSSNALDPRLRGDDAPIGPCRARNRRSATACRTGRDGTSTLRDARRAGHPRR